MKNTDQLQEAEREFNRISVKAAKLIYQLEELTADIPQKGNTPNECQKTNILSRIKDLENAFNGLCIEDFIKK